MRRLMEYFRQVKCNHEYKTINDTIERIEDERSLGLVRYEYNRTRKICKHCDYVREENVAMIPNRI